MGLGQRVDNYSLQDQRSDFRNIGGVGAVTRGSTILRRPASAGDMQEVHGSCRGTALWQNQRRDMDLGSSDTGSLSAAPACLPKVERIRDASALERNALPSKR